MVAVVLMAFAGGDGRFRPSDTPTVPTWATRDLRAGIIGTDTSHVPQFTKIFASRPEWRIKVVAAYKGGSPDLPISANRLEGFARTIHRSTASSSWTASTRSSPRWTSCSSRASTAGRTSRRSRPCSRPASACSSTSRSRRASTTRGNRRAVETNRHAVLQRIVGSLSSRPGATAGECRRRQRHARRGELRPEQDRLSSRPLLLRHPRRRGALRRDGAGLCQPLAARHVTNPTSRRAGGVTGASARITAFRKPILHGRF